jgi:hypothetical protein
LDHVAYPFIFYGTIDLIVLYFYFIAPHPSLGRFILLLSVDLCMRYKARNYFLQTMHKIRETLEATPKLKYIGAPPVDLANEID